MQRPDLLSLGLGTFDLFHYDADSNALDIRLEHRWGYALYASAQGTFQLRPFAGIETTPKASLYGFGGFVLDWMVSEHWVLSPHIAVGLYHQGDGKDLGSALEFRSAMEGGYRFTNDVRLTAHFSHISNANIVSSNPGSEMLGVYLHLPLR
jgi:hypothetical protein